MPRASGEQRPVLGHPRDEGEQRIRDTYGTDKYDRLRALKHEYDPDNFFRLNQNIPPR